MFKLDFMTGHMELKIKPPLLIRKSKKKEYWIVLEYVKFGGKMKLKDAEEMYQLATMVHHV